MSHDVGLLLISMANDMTFKNWSKHFWGGLSSTILKPAGCVSAEKKTINSSPSNLSSRTCWYLSGFKFSKGERGYGGLVWVISRQTDSQKSPLNLNSHFFCESSRSFFDRIQYFEFDIFQQGSPNFFKLRATSWVQTASSKMTILHCQREHPDHVNDFA